MRKNGCNRRQIIYDNSNDSHFVIVRSGCDANQTPAFIVFLAAVNRGRWHDAALIPVVLFLSQGHEQDAARIALAVVILLTMPMLYNRVLRHFLLIPAGIAFVLGSLLWFEHLRM